MPNHTSDQGTISGAKVLDIKKPPHGAPRAPSGPLLTGADTDPDRWMPNAACRTADPEDFFGPDGERITSRERREKQARKTCATCPVSRQCLGYAVATKQGAGIWGGTSPEERIALAQVNP